MKNFVCAIVCTRHTTLLHTLAAFKIILLKLSAGSLGVSDYLLTLPNKYNLNSKNR